MSSNDHLRIVCVYTENDKDSVKVANRCVKSGQKFGYTVELYPGVHWSNIKKVRKEYGLKFMMPVASSKAHFDPTINAPAPRVGNGLTHYALYKWAADNSKPICIVEHDAVFVGKIPEPIDDGIIQISSHRKGQANMDIWKQCNRALKMETLYPERKIIHNDGSHGIHPHPLYSLNGTSGYVVGPIAARKMVAAIQSTGVTYADRVTVEYVGENLYLQVPQSVECDHKIKSCENF